MNFSLQHTVGRHNWAGPAIRSVLVWLLVALLAACSITQSSSPSTNHGPSDPVVIPISVRGGQGTALGAHPMVEVRVGRSSEVPVLLDTGSVGLHIFAPAVSTKAGSGVTMSNAAQSITYSGGSVFTGVQAYAVITIGSRATSSVVPFALVEHASCTATKPVCPTARGMGEEIAAGEYGILGIGLSRARSGLSSPLLAMPGALGRTWSIHLRARTGSLVLGAQVPATTQDATIHLLSEGDATFGRSWADSRVSLCFSVGSTHGCAPSLFDTGTFAMQLTGTLFAQVPVGRTSTEVLGGTTVAVSVNGSPEPFWRFAAGAVKSDDLVVVRRAKEDFVNCAVQAFYAFTIVYDDALGTMTLVPDARRTTS